MVIKISIRAHDLSIIKENLTPEEAAKFLNKSVKAIYKASKLLWKLDGYIVSRQSTEYLVLIEKLKLVAKDNDKANQVISKAIKELSNTPTLTEVIGYNPALLEKLTVKPFAMNKEDETNGN